MPLREPLPMPLRLVSLELPWCKSFHERACSTTVQLETASNHIPVVARTTKHGLYRLGGRKQIFESFLTGLPLCNHRLPYL